MGDRGWMDVQFSQAKGSGGMVCPYPSLDCAVCSPYAQALR